MLGSYLLGLGEHCSALAVLTGCAACGAGEWTPLSPASQEVKSNSLELRLLPTYAQQHACTYPYTIAENEQRTSLMLTRLQTHIQL